MKPTSLAIMMLGVYLLASAPASARQPQVGEDHFFQVSVDNNNPYIGQQIRYRFELFDAADLSDPLYESPDFEGFWRVDLGEARQDTRQIGDRFYSVSVVDTVLFPTRNGDLTIAGGSLILPETVFRPRQIISVDPVTVHVQQLPPGAPSGYGGAVGEFAIESRLIDSRQNRIFVLQLEIQGTGNVEQLAPPSLTLPEGWSFSVQNGAYTSSLVNDQLFGRRVLDYMLTPGDTPLDQIPAVNLPYFDPATTSYQIAIAPPLEVATFVATPNLIDSRGTTPLELSWVTHLSAPLAVSDHPPWGLFMIPILIFMGGLVWRWLRLDFERRKPAILRGRALREAYKLLRTAESALSPIQANQILLLAFQTYFARRISTRPSDLTPSDIEAGLRHHQLSSSIIKAVMICLEQADQGVYAPPGVGHSAPIEEARAALIHLHENWQ